MSYDLPAPAARSASFHALLSRVLPAPRLRTMFACGLPAQAARARAPCLSRGAARCVASAASRLEKGAPGGAGGHAVGEFACPTLLNNVPYHTALRQHFYTELASSVRAAPCAYAPRSLAPLGGGCCA